MRKPIKTLNDMVRAAIILAVQNVFYALARDVTGWATDMGPVLVVAPHPDDETLGCGGFIARARQAGQRIVIVIATDGSTWPVSATMTPAQVAAMRHEETLRAAAVLGVEAQDVVFLDVPEREAGAHEHAIAAGLRRQIELVRPRLVISPYGIDNSPDHRAVARVVDRLCRDGTIACPVLEYPIWFWLRAGLEHLTSPSHTRRLRRVVSCGCREAKKRAMIQHASQCPHLVGNDYSDSCFRPFTFAVQYFSRYEYFFEKEQNGVPHA